MVMVYPPNELKLSKINCIGKCIITGTANRYLFDINDRNYIDVDITWDQEIENLPSKIIAHWTSGLFKLHNQSVPFSGPVTCPAWHFGKKENDDDNVILAMLMDVNINDIVEKYIVLLGYFKEYIDSFRSGIINITEFIPFTMERNVFYIAESIDEFDFIDKYLVRLDKDSIESLYNHYNFNIPENAFSWNGDLISNISPAKQVDLLKEYGHYLLIWYGKSSPYGGKICYSHIQPYIFNGKDLFIYSTVLSGFEANPYSNLMINDNLEIIYRDYTNDDLVIAKFILNNDGYVTNVIYTRSQIDWSTFNYDNSCNWGNWQYVGSTCDELHHTLEKNTTSGESNQTAIWIYDKSNSIIVDFEQTSYCENEYYSHENGTSSGSECIEWSGSYTHSYQYSYNSTETIDFGFYTINNEYEFSSNGSANDNWSGESNTYWKSQAMYEAQIINQETSNIKYSFILFIDLKNKILIIAEANFLISLNSINMWNYNNDDEIYLDISQTIKLKIITETNEYIVQSYTLSLNDKFNYISPSVQFQADQIAYYPPLMLGNNCTNGSDKNTFFNLWNKTPTISKKVGSNFDPNLDTPAYFKINEYNTPFYSLITTKIDYQQSSDNWFWESYKYPFVQRTVCNPLRNIYNNWDHIKNGYLFAHKSYFGDDVLYTFQIPKMKNNWEGVEIDGFHEICYANGNIIDVSDPNFEYIKL